jgi:hypothetical protein
MASDGNSDDDSQRYIGSGSTWESVKYKPCNRTFTHHLFAMTDQELKDLVASLAVKSDRLDAQLAQTQGEVAETSRVIKEIGIRMDAESTETSRVIKEVGRRMGAMASNQGDVAEEFFYNTLFDKPEVGGIRFDRVLKNISGGKPGHQAEFDVVMHNGSSMAIIEVKYKAHTNDVEQVERQLERYRDIFPEYKDYKLYGGLAGFSVPEDVAQAARDKGLFVLKRKGDLVEAETLSMKAF